MSWSGSSQGFPTPRSATVRTDRATFGPAVAEVAASLGTPFMPWQAFVADVALEHERGRLAYRNAVVSVPRQSGKTTLTLALVVWRLLSRPGLRAAYGAQSRLAARGKLLDDWWPRLAASPLGELFTVSRVNGSESLRASNGSMLSLLSTEETTGHGSTFDLAILDEAWALDHRAEQAVRPAMVTKRNAQLWLLSTAGTDRSVYWRSKVDAGRTAADAGMVDGVCYFEWSAPADADISDEATWWACMPAMGHKVEPATIRADLAAMDLAEFARAYMNWWASESNQGWTIVSRAAWEASQL